MEGLIEEGQEQIRGDRNRSSPRCCASRCGTESRALRDRSLWIGDR